MKKRMQTINLLASLGKESRNFVTTKTMPSSLKNLLVSFADSKHKLFQNTSW